MGWSGLECPAESERGWVGDSVECSIGQSIDDLRPALGEGSDYQRAHGIYLNPVSPKLLTLPAGWEARLIRVGRDGVVAHFLEPHDAAVSKLARGEQRDLRWVRAGARASILSLATVALLMKTADFYDAQEKATAMAMLARLKRR